VDERLAFWRKRLSIVAGRRKDIRAAGAGRQERRYHVEVLQPHLGNDDRGDINTGGTKRGTEEDARSGFVS
jgi:hypothetical protein